MKSTLTLITVLSLFTLISCSPVTQNQEQTQQLPVPPPIQEQTQQIPAQPPSQEQSIPAITEPSQAVEIKPTEQPAVDQKEAAVMLNPPHGQPYHRCEIPVGAPLPPTTNATTQTTNATSQTTNQQVEVAAPQTTVPPPSVENNPYAPTIDNAKKASASQSQNTAPANTGTKPRLNPAHGQPWHRCDIAVGSPLP